MLNVRIWQDFANFRREINHVSSIIEKIDKSEDTYVISKPMSEISLDDILDDDDDDDF